MIVSLAKWAFPPNWRVHGVGLSGAEWPSLLCAFEARSLAVAGTGKTSLIKAMASHTGRHVVSIPLPKIKTNQELMDMMFDLRYPLAGLHAPRSHALLPPDPLPGGLDVGHSRPHCQLDCARSNPCVAPTSGEGSRRNAHDDDDDAGVDDLPVPLDFSKVIFVMEDVDAAGEHTRGHTHYSSTHQGVLEYSPIVRSGACGRSTHRGLSHSALPCACAL